MARSGLLRRKPICTADCRSGAMICIWKGVLVILVCVMVSRRSPFPLPHTCMGYAWRIFGRASRGDRCSPDMWNPPEIGNRYRRASDRVSSMSAELAFRRFSQASVPSVLLSLHCAPWLSTMTGTSLISIKGQYFK